MLATLVLIAIALVGPAVAGAHSAARAQADVVAERMVGEYVDSLQGLAIVASVDRVTTRPCAAWRPSKGHVHRRTCGYRIWFTLADAARMRCAGTVDVRVRSAASSRLVGTRHSPACAVER